MKNWRELLAQRESATHFVVEGQLAVDRLLASDYETVAVFRIGENLTREEASHILGYQFHRGVLALAKKPEPVPLSRFGTGTLVALPEIADPGNLGAIIRNVAALGGSGVILGKGISPYNAKAIRASAGNLFRIPVRCSPDILADLTELQQTHILIGADLSAQSQPFTTLPQLSKPPLLILGPEDFGIDATVRSLCHHLAHLPMDHDIDSLNVACSSAIFLHLLNQTHFTPHHALPPLSR